jgi:membrane protease YdiL (CAAX protease family)
VVGVEGGVLLSAAYVLTRRLWLAIGIHFGWDFSQDAIFGGVLHQIKLPCLVEEAAEQRSVIVTSPA